MGSDYLKEVLTLEGNSMPNITSKISELINNVSSLKANVKRVVEHDSIQFTPLLRENDQLKLKSSNLLREIAVVQQQIDGEVKNKLSSCTEELEDLSTSLKEVKLFLETLKQLIGINTLVKKAKQQMEEKEFYECTESITAAQALITDNSEKLKLLDSFKVLSQEVILTYEQLMHQIFEIWSNCVYINVKNNSDENLTEISVLVDQKSSSDLNKILKALDLLNSNLIIKKFSDILLNDILKEVILKKSKISSNFDHNKATLLIEIFSDDCKPNYLEVFNSIKVIIEFLKLHLDTEITKDVYFLSKVGSHIANEFTDFLIKNCLSETVPSSSDDFDNYNVIVENSEVFEKTLQKTGFLHNTSSSFLDYAKNINVLFANKFYQSYLHKARIIMKKDLHNVTKSEDVVSNIGILPAFHRKLLKEKLNIQEEGVLFSKCQVSKQADELMKLVNSMMIEVQKSLDLCAVRLFFTIRNIFEMYSAIVPLHHKKFLETLPHQVALFHNNCLYFTHNLINLATKYYNKIPHVLKDHFTILLEEAIILRSLAAETLEFTVTNQRNQLIYILKDSGFATLNENPKLDSNSEKSIRQCIRQLQILQAAWNEVLPLNIYNKAIGFLLDAVIEELINLIIAVEDISSQAASDLVTSFTVLLDKASNLFPESKEIHKHSRKWQKFKEFVLVLKGSLRDIDERWGSGMGPLAAEFTAEEVKHLVRALFQNSDRRAALLTRIR